MKAYTTKLLVAAAAAVGVTQVALANPPPFTGATGPGLYLYDTATGDHQFVAAPLALPGNVNFSGSVGDYTVVLNASGATFAGGVYPQIDLQIQAAQTSTAGDQLLLYYSYGLFGPSLGGVTLSTTLNPANQTSMTSTAYWGTTGAFDVTHTILTLADPGSASGSINSGSSQYYLTLQDTITGNVTSADSLLTVVPEPTTVLAGALMLLPLGIGAVRSLRKERSA